MWAYDLHLYTVAYFTRGGGEDLFAMRGAVLAMLVAAVRARHPRHIASWKVQISRAATFQSLSVIAILAYLIADDVGVAGDGDRRRRLGSGRRSSASSFVMTRRGPGAAAVGAGARLAAGDRRQASSSSIATIIARNGCASPTRSAASGEDSASLEERVVKALADIGGSPGGLLLLRRRALSPRPRRRAGTGTRRCRRPATAPRRWSRFIEDRPTSSISTRSAAAG